jgi:hypothetical protein
MTTRLGLEVRERELCAVMLRSGTLCWHGRVTLADSVPLSESVAELLATAPRRGLVRAQLRVALGLGSAQVKRLHGLPSLRHRSQMTQLLRENAGALFLRTFGAAVIPEVHRTGDGQCWGALLDRAALEMVVVAAQHCRWRVVLVVPTISALARVHVSGVLVLSDGAHHVELTTDRGELRGVRRVSAGAAQLTIPAPLRELGEDAVAFVGAYAAALSARNDPLAWTPEASPARATAIRRAKLTAWTVALAAACAAAVVAPTLRAALFVRREGASAIRTRATELEVARTDAELLRATQLLNAVDAFDASRGQLTRMLAALGQAIPESTAIVALRVDSIEGSFVAVSPHVADLLAELGSVDQMAGARIVGSLTRETLAGARLERATFRFRRPRAANAHSIPTTTRR